MKGFTHFGEYFKTKRLALGMTLREFCIKHDLDAVYISKLERGRVAPPHDEVELRTLAQCLKLNSKEWQTFQELALTSGVREKMPNTELIKHLPLLVRTLPDTQINRDVLKKLAEKIRSA